MFITSLDEMYYKVLFLYKYFHYIKKKILYLELLYKVVKLLLLLIIALKHRKVDPVLVSFYLKTS